MSELLITQLEKDLYKFEAKGCPLKFFVIWENCHIPRPEDWYQVNPIGKNYYTMTKVIKDTKGIHFHVYNGNNPEYFRGKYYFSSEDKINFDENNNNQQEKNYLIRLREMELQYQLKTKEIQKEFEEMKKTFEETKKVEEHKELINKANSEIQNLESELINNYEIKISQKMLNNIYEQYKLLDINNILPKKDLTQIIDKNMKTTSETAVKTILSE